MRVLFATAEVYPLAKTGGLADASRGLAISLKRRGIDIQLVVPGYASAFEHVERPETVANLEPMMGIADATLIRGLLPRSNVPVWLVNAPALFQRQGGIYQDEQGRDWPDSAVRFAYFAHAAHGLATGRYGSACSPDIVHANDWHTGLLPLLLRSEEAPGPGTVFTVHNMAFQGNFPMDVVPSLGLPSGCRDYVEFHGQMCFLKAGISCADRITTVSPTYAREVLTPELGCGMDGVLRARGPQFSGILNGIDEACWNPATDPSLPCGYIAKDLSGKGMCKLALQREFGLAQDSSAVVLGFVSRLTKQKMADVVLQLLPWLGDQPVQFVLMGIGDREIEVGLVKEAWQHRGKLAVKIGYDERLAHLLIAGSDILLAPARFEPCGLTQLYALRYGTLPVVRRTGGLADTITDANTPSIKDGSASGFIFDEPTAEGLRSSIERALDTYHKPLQWRTIQRNVMAKDLGWNSSADKYVALYSDVSAADQVGAEEAGAAYEPQKAVK